MRVLALAAILLAACATQPPAATSATRTDAQCVRATGSRIARPEGRCVPGAPGRSYSREELERTGEVDTGAALKSLHPR